MGMLVGASVIALLFFNVVPGLQTYRSIVVSLVGALVGMAAAVAFSALRSQDPRASAFLCYSLKDRSAAKEVKARLGDIGVVVFDAESDVLVGQDLKATVDSLIENADFAVGLMSRNTLESDWVQMEIQIIERKKKKLFPVKLDDVEIPTRLQHLKYADLATDKARGLQALVDSVRTSFKLEQRTSQTTAPG